MVYSRDEDPEKANVGLLPRHMTTEKGSSLMNQYGGTQFQIRVSLEMENQSKVEGNGGIQGPRGIVWARKASECARLT